MIFLKKDFLGLGSIVKFVSLDKGIFLGHLQAALGEEWAPLVGIGNREFFSHHGSVLVHNVLLLCIKVLECLLQHEKKNKCFPCANVNNYFFALKKI